MRIFPDFFIHASGNDYGTILSFLSIRNTDFTMSIMASKNTGDSAVCLAVCLD